MSTPINLPTSRTEALYQKDGTKYTHTSTLETLHPLSSFPEETRTLFKLPTTPAHESHSAPFILTTPSTIFHAQGGGQPSDTGTITFPQDHAQDLIPSTLHIHQVRKPATSSSILHLGTFSPSSTPSLPLGAPIHQTISIPTRTLHSRLHTAGHALGLAIYQLSASGALPSDLKDGKASHYPGSACVEFHGLIPGTAKETIQAKVDELVARDLEIGIAFLSRERADREWCYACGGTHVQRLGEVGRVVVRGIRRQKGVSRVGYEVV
ncbi:alanyl-tRNA synthetase-like protein [Dendryphion nanum]|uniref:Alanyl-tRNA synthetase-like protein n=1 Tax=Dendryphion nanum TaxID=256645 RepID=A0A9P9IBA4_9PLEO|nr:alanyl-tRNA synthetase-like protein [Dendryphion nanum]